MGTLGGKKELSFLICSRLPDGSESAVAQGTRNDEPAAGIISAKLAKALGNTWRARIVAEVSLRPMSASEFVDQVGGELTNISRCFRQLAEWDYIEVVEERTGGQRRGGIEKVYRAIQRAHFDTPTWAQLPKILMDDITSNVLASYFERISEAIEAGTFDAEVDRHLSWDKIQLDRVAWTQLIERLDEVLASLPELAAESAERMAETGEEPIPTTVGLAGFRSPKNSEKSVRRTQPQTPTDPDAIPPD
jgi:DNA-binding transcriptional regulator GbsR (MarR family)